MRRDRWWDVPGVFALMVVLPGLSVAVGVYALLSFLIHGEWPTW